jgi:hypothetical protein
MSIASLMNRGKRVAAAGTLAAVVLVGASGAGTALGAGVPGAALPWTWTQQTAGAAPQARHDAGMAYDRLRGNIVLFGGTNDGTGIPRTTWIWTGSFWTETTTTSRPAALTAVAMDWDGVNGKVIMFGGNSPPCTPICTVWNSTYEFDGTNWSLLHPVNSPPARAGGRIVWDSTRRQVVLFGGSGRGGSFLNDTWTWDGTNWTEKHPATVPQTRYYPQLAFDPMHQQVVLFGGDGWNDFMLGDTWTWDGTNWTQQLPATSPVPRSDATMVFDVALKAIVLFGGDQQERADLTLNDTWAWTGTTWRQLAPVGTLPAARWRQSMAYDATRNVMVMFGGKTGSTENGILLNDTWTLHQ